jgi:hypothetical protein
MKPRTRQARKMREPTQQAAVPLLPPWLGAVAFLCASAFYVTAALLSPPLVGLYHDDGIPKIQDNFPATVKDLPETGKLQRVTPAGFPVTLPGGGGLSV